MKRLLSQVLTRLITHYRMKYVLREQPEFSITLGDDDFTVIDEHRKGQSGTYAYKELKEVQFREKQVNVFVVLLDLVFYGSGSVKKDPWLLKITLKSKRIRLYPEENFLSKSRSIAEVLNTKF